MGPVARAVFDEGVAMGMGLIGTDNPTGRMHVELLGDDRTGDHGGYLFPVGHHRPMATVLETGSAGLGEEATIQGRGDPFLDALFPRSLLSLGVRLLPVPYGTTSLLFVRVEGSAGATWVAETPGSDVADSNQTFEAVVLTLKSVMTSLQVSNQLMRQITPSISRIYDVDFARSVAAIVDAALINGDGVLEPEGAIANADIPSHSIGGVPVWSDFTELLRQIEAADAADGSLGFATTTGLQKLLRDTERFTGGGIPIWRDDSTIAGVPVRASTNVPSDLGAGSDHAILAGEWSSAVVAMTPIELVADRTSLKKQGVTEVLAFTEVGVAFLRPAAFRKVTDAALS